MEMLKRNVADLGKRIVRVRLDPVLQLVDDLCVCIVCTSREP